MQGIIMKTFTKQSKAFTKKNNSFFYLGLEVRDDTTLCLSYEYTPLGVNLTTSTQIENKTGKLFALSCCYTFMLYNKHVFL